MNRQIRTIAELDRVIHEPGRLMIAALLFAVDRSDHVTLNAWPYGLFGLGSMAAGALLFFFPKQGASVLTLLFGSYSIVFGVILLHLAWRLYVHHQHIHRGGLHPVNRSS